jgi:hypothetical protein
MDSSLSDSQTQASGFLQSLSNRASEQRSPSPNKNTFNPDCLKVVGRYRRGTLSKTHAFLELFEWVSHVDQSEFRGQSLPNSLPLTTGCSTLLKKKLSMLENRIERARKKLQRMERDHEAMKIVKTNQTTWTPKKTLSQRLTNLTLLQRMTSRCTKSNKDLN